MRFILVIWFCLQSIFMWACSANSANGAVPAGPNEEETADTLKLSRQMRVLIKGENLYIGARLDTSYDILYWFKKCMFNNLYTFYQVGIYPNSDFMPLSDPSIKPSHILNLAFSDNIGPFSISGYGWCGGNHPYVDNITPTGYNITYQIILDGNPCTDEGSFWANKVELLVENCILNPAIVQQIDGKNILESPLTVETVRYQIKGNSIGVKLMHEFKNEKPVTVQTYYGMQSMYMDEVYTMTIGGAYSNWTQQNGVSTFNKGAYPDMCCFLEKNHVASQASYLFNTGLGMHNDISDEDIIFIGNSNGKSYHKLISNKEFVKGDKIEWEGVYVWFRTPVFENEQFLCFEGNIEGNRALFIQTKKGVDTVLPLPEYTNGRFRILESRGDIKIEGNTFYEGKLKVKSNGSTGCVLLLQ